MRCLAGRVGAVVVSLVVSGSALAQVQQATFSDPLQIESEDFGRSVSVSGRVAAVGAPSHPIPYTNTGKVFLFSPNSGGSWTSDGTLQAPVPTQNELYGRSVSTDGTRVAVGAPGAADTDYGQVFVYRRDTPGWVLEATIAAPTNAQGQFGYSVDLSGSALAVGSRTAANDVGRVSIFERSGTSWTLNAVLSPPSSALRFGTSLDLDGERCIGGAPQTSVGGLPLAGQAIVFKRLSGSNWHQEAVLSQPTPRSTAEFGYSVALEGTEILVGCPKAEVTLTTTLGRVYAFHWNGTAWTQTQALADVGTADDFDHFGTSVRICGRMAIIGAQDADFTVSEPDSGATYLFELELAGWTLLSRFASASIASDDRFGCSVSISPAHILVGAELAELAEGRAYLFSY